MSIDSLTEDLYVENRVWMLGSRLVINRQDKSRIEYDPVNIPLNRILGAKVFSSPQDCVSVSLVTEPNRPRTTDQYKLRLSINFEQSALSYLSHQFFKMPAAQEWRLIRFQLFLYDIGQLNIRIKFAIPSNDTLSFLTKPEEITDHISNEITQSLYKMLLRPIVSELVKLRYITVFSTFMWGVPEFIGRAGYNSYEVIPLVSYEDTYALTSHLFICGERADSLDIVKIEGDELAGFKNRIEWGMRVWVRKRAIEFCEDKDIKTLDEVLSLDALYLMQLNIITSACYIYAAILNRLAWSTSDSIPQIRLRWNEYTQAKFNPFRVRRSRRVKQITSEKIRTLMNLNNSQLLVLQAQDAELSTKEHLNVLSQMRDCGTYNHSIQQYREAEACVEKAVVGLEAAQIEKQARIIEVVLLIFGSLGVYSILNDLMQMAREDPEFTHVRKWVPFPFGWVSNISWLLLIVTLILASIVFVVLWNGKRR